MWRRDHRSKTVVTEQAVIPLDSPESRASPCAESQSVATWRGRVTHAVNPHNPANLFAPQQANIMVVASPRLRPT